MSKKVFSAGVVFLAWLFGAPRSPCFEFEVVSQDGITLFPYERPAGVEILDGGGVVCWSGWIDSGKYVHADLHPGTYRIRSAVPVGAQAGPPPAASPSGEGGAVPPPPPCRAGGVRVIPVPWLGNPDLPHVTYRGREVRLKATLCGTPGMSYRYQWDALGDGSVLVPPQPTDVVDPYAIDAAVIYPDARPGTLYQARIRIWQGGEVVAESTYPVKVSSDFLETKVRVAIDEGLWYLHKAMARSQSGTTPIGVLPYVNAHTGDAGVAYTAAVVEAFEENHHRPEGDPEVDPYSDTVARALNSLLSQMRVQPLSVQPAGDPDTKDSAGAGNGIGLYDGPSLYDTPMVLVALVRSGAPDRISPTFKNPGAVSGGRNFVDGRPYREIAQDIVDYLAWAQVDRQFGIHRGGWRYGPNSATADSSVTQWPVLGFLIAERAEGFGVKVPGFVRAELMELVKAPQACGSGCFDYSSGIGYCYPGETAAGLLCLDWLNIGPADPQQGKLFRGAVDCLAAGWCNPTCNPCTWNKAWDGQTINLLFGDYYAMYGIMKAAQLAVSKPMDRIGDHDWYEEFAGWLTARSPADPNVPCDSRQTREGNWPANAINGSNPIGAVLNTAWAITILSNIRCNRPEIETFTAAPEETDARVVVAFEVRAHDINDPPLEIREYSFDFGDGTGYTETTDAAPDGLFDGKTTHPFSRCPESYLVTVSAFNGCARSTSRIEVTCKPPDHRPFPGMRIVSGAVRTSKPGLDYLTFQDQRVVLSGLPSFDIDEPPDFITRYEWAFHCGEFGAPESSCDIRMPSEDDGCPVTHAWSVEGTYPRSTCIQIRVTDRSDPRWAPPTPSSASHTSTIEVLPRRELSRQLKVFDHEGKLWLDAEEAIGRFDPALPTIAFTHGWNPSVTGIDYCYVLASFASLLKFHWDGDLNAGGGDELHWTRSLAMLISARLDGGINLLAWDWMAEASGPCPTTGEILPQARALSRELTALFLRTGYRPGEGAARLQLIGHSLGASVMAEAANFLATLDWEIAQVTCFDPPDAWLVFLAGSQARDICIPIMNLKRKQPAAYVEIYDGVASFRRSFFSEGLLLNNNFHQADLWVDVPQPALEHGVQTWYEQTIPVGGRPTLYRCNYHCLPPLFSLCAILPGTVGFGTSAVLARPDRPSCEGVGTIVVDHGVGCDDFTFRQREKCVRSARCGCLNPVLTCPQPSPDLTIDLERLIPSPSIAYRFDAPDGEGIITVTVPGIGEAWGVITLPFDTGFVSAEGEIRSLPGAPGWEDAWLRVFVEPLRSDGHMGYLPWPSIFEAEGGGLPGEGFLESDMIPFCIPKGTAIRIRLRVYSPAPGAVFAFRKVNLYKDPWAANLPPTVSALDQEVTAGEDGIARVALRAVYHDPEGLPGSFLWRIDGEVVADGDRPVVPLPVGKYRVEVVAFDPQGASGEDTCSLDVLPPVTSFKRGDANIDGTVDISDAIGILNWLFLGTGVMACLDAADTNDSGSVDITDPIGVLDFVFLGGVPPAAPGDEVCGPDPTDEVPPLPCTYDSRKCSAP